ncbi:Putative 4-nitrophenylphosphatase [Cavenderia fasciculata]|uniref:4-nitrophenylphosphatase n=1 Tax=Cavenderia fasciculata TaxID=261658 RepID=F4Q9U0_CACFS|nr:Putative 4-nitrophenylphosphatase [Cavenderia fasciculata]EGG15459.1 Putative 4-nitrophenylphosphatase [Cavenderia fasciculata]|eukprot:XP_004354201.1 Putative 4-nitrophenylphosphatase [Cavenderia fasciculata]
MKDHCRGKMIMTTNTTPSIDLNQHDDQRHAFLDSIDTLIFDCDGVLWLDHHVIPGACEALAKFRSMGKKIKFVTNNSTMTRHQFLVKIQSFGIECSIDEIYGSAYGTALYLKSIQFNKKIFMIGEAGLENELRDAGYSPIKFNTDHTVSGISNAQNIEIERDIGAVIVGMDTSLTYSKCVYAHKAITQIPGCMFIATNTDHSYPVRDGTLPGAGSIVTMIQSSTSKAPIIVGKPETLLMDVIIKNEGLDRSRTLMVGDRLNTDILFGINSGTKTLLVLTGISNKQSIIEENIIPHFILNTIADLI